MLAILVAHLLGATVSTRVMSAGDGYKYPLKTIADRRRRRVALNASDS